MPLIHENGIDIIVPENTGMIVPISPVPPIDAATKLGSVNTGTVPAPAMSTPMSVVHPTAVVPDRRSISPVPPINAATKLGPVSPINARETLASDEGRYPFATIPVSKTTITVDDNGKSDGGSGNGVSGTGVKGKRGRGRKVTPGGAAAETVGGDPIPTVASEAGTSTNKRKRGKAAVVAMDTVTETKPKLTFDEQVALIAASGTSRSRTKKQRTS